MSGTTTAGRWATASKALVLALVVAGALPAGAQVLPYGVRLAWEGHCFMASSDAEQGDTGPLVGTSMEFVDRTAYCYVFDPDYGLFETVWNGSAVAALGQLLGLSRAGSTSFYPGSAAGWILAEWGDTLHVESPTLAPGTPVSLRFSFAMEAWFTAGEELCVGNDGRVEATFEAIATSDTPSGSASIVATPCPPQTPIPGSFVLTLPVGASVPVRGTMRVDAEASASAIGSYATIDAQNHYFTIDPLAPDVGYSTASGADYRSVVPPVCGNHLIEVGEGCDDGNLADGDCCSSLCVLEPSGGACADDGDPCTADVCDGAGACVHPPVPGGDSDGDGACDAVDPCTNVGGARDLLAEPPARLNVRGVGVDPVVGNDRLQLRGEIPLPAGAEFATIDPLLTGARVIVQGADGVPRVDAMLPAVAYAGRDSHGWKVSDDRRTWRWVDRTAAPIAGIVRMVIAGRGTPPAERARISVAGRRATYALGAADVPIQATVTLGGASMAQAGFCGETRFGAAECVVRGGGTRIECRGGG